MGKVNLLVRLNRIIWDTSLVLKFQLTKSYFSRARKGTERNLSDLFKSSSGAQSGGYRHSQ